MSASVSPARGRSLLSVDALMALGAAFTVIVAAWRSASVLEFLAYLTFGIAMLWIVSSDWGPAPATTNGVVAVAGLAVVLLAVSSLGADVAASMQRALAAGIVAGVTLFALRLLYPAGISIRSIATGTLVAIFMGAISWTAVWFAFVVTSLLAGVFAGFLIARRGAQPTQLIPTAPFFSIAAILTTAVFG